MGKVYTCDECGKFTSYRSGGTDTECGFMCAECLGSMFQCNECGEWFVDQLEDDICISCRLLKERG